MNDQNGKFKLNEEIKQIDSKNMRVRREERIESILPDEKNNRNNIIVAYKKWKEYKKRKMKKKRRKRELGEVDETKLKR